MILQSGVGSRVNS